MSSLSLAPFFSSYSIQSPIGKLTYHPGMRMFSTEAFTSAAGNTYFEGIRLSDQLVIRVSFGIGWARNFVNCIRIYAADGSGMLIARQDYHIQFFSEVFMQEEFIRLLHDALLEANYRNKLGKTNRELHVLAEQLISVANNTNQRDIVSTRPVPLLMGP